MNSPATVKLSIEPPTAAGVGRVLRAAIRRVTWRVVVVTLATTVVLDAWAVFSWVYESPPKLPAAESYVSGAIINLLMAFCIMLTTLFADEMVARGAKRLPAYAFAVVAGSAVASLAQWQVHQWLRTNFDLFDIPHERAVTQPVSVFLEYLIWGAIIVSIYVNRRTALQAAARLHAAQVKCAQAQHRTLESRLQALQARVEPQFLFRTLARVRDLYESDPGKGGQMLDDLIVYLRAALPHLRDSAPTLEQELELAGAYLSIVEPHQGGLPGFAIDAPPAVLAARMQPMILLPLINLVLAGGSRAVGSAIRIAARREAGRLRVELSGSGGCLAAADSGDLLCDIRERLHALYGDRGSLAFESSGSVDMCVVLDIPYEATHGDHR